MTQPPENTIASIPRIHRLDSIQRREPARPPNSPEQLRKRVLHQLALLKNELAGLNSNSSKKNIHNMRVLSRRLRAAFTLLKPWTENSKFKALLKKIRKLTEILGPVRSLDVALSDLKKQSGDPKENPASLPLFIEWVRKRRKKFRKKLPQQIDEIQILKAFGRFKPQKLHHLPSQDLQITLDKKLAKALNRVEKGWNLFQKKQKMEELHALRIDLKKWRYLFEIKSEIGEVYGASDFLEKVKSLQDRLGGIHDLEVLQEMASSPKLRRIARGHRLENDLKAFVKDLGNQMDQELHLFLKEGEKAIMEIIAFTQGSESLSSGERTPASAHS